MAADKVAVYWDSCVFIDLLRQTPGRYERCKHIHELAEKGDLLIVTSTVTITEVVRLPDAGGLMPEDQSRQLLDYFENPYISIRQLDRATAERAHELCRAHNLIHLDAIHLATALASGRISTFYTFDSKKQRRKGLLKWDSKIGDPPLNIKEPPEPPPPPPPPPPPEKTLFDSLDGTADDTVPKEPAAPPEPAEQ